MLPAGSPLPPQPVVSLLQGPTKACHIEDNNNSNDNSNNSDSDDTPNNNNSNDAPTNNNSDDAPNNNTDNADNNKCDSEDNNTPNLLGATGTVTSVLLFLHYSQTHRHVASA